MMGQETYVQDQDYEAQETARKPLALSDQLSADG